MNRLGIDIGRVIIDSPPGEDTAFFHGDRATVLRTPFVPGAFEAIPRLVELFDGQAWLVSKCGPRIQQRSLDWLHHHRFFELTGLPADNVRFCLRRPDKAIHCAELGITHFIDDKADVHEALHGVVPNRYLFGPQRRTPADLVHTPDWPSAEAAIRRTLADRTISPEYFLFAKVESTP
ncbi:hypothetical protein [Kribbella sp. VKM Ac-2568]|uniref:hypothetical protein n=1 Tax=Kribbella sp. VKM Ac-2568 TaxID=2512219 RepID=UPI001049CD1C|nr:hypothetical protein [Kribbella sp. VKM Ac-2568]TCM47731.1 hypothetical protein EV648_104123 [Kribbella sp. VKM Ac-2568]